MADLTIYGAKFSRAARCIWAAGELGLDFEHFDVPFSDPSLKQPPYLAKNPMGKVPAIEHGDYPLWESMAINYYLAELKPGPMWPQDLKARARIMQWTFWAVAEVEGSAITLGMNSGMLPEARRNPEAAKQALERLQRPLRVLEDAVSPSPYLLGDSFTLADLNVAGIMWSIHEGKARLEGFPASEAWLARCLERPAAKAAFGAPVWG